MLKEIGNDDLSSLPEYHAKFLAWATRAAIKDLLSQAPNVLWVFLEKSHPEASIIRGVLRSLRLELSTSKLVLLQAPFDAFGAEAIARIVKHTLWVPNSPVQDEQEYSVIDNVIHVPRLQLVGAVKETFAAEAGELVKKE